LMQCIVAGWMFPIEKLRAFLNEVSDFKIGKWWTFCIRWLTPAVLAVMLVQNLYAEITKAYGGYPVWSLWVGGWLVTAVLIAGSLYLQYRNREVAT
ncbi:MAG TPA: sodium-dependent transporter, partial [Bacteroidetes bacterium]|nr:sodium-dependent transporter [Bacteroidota bacterium]